MNNTAKRANEKLLFISDAHEQFYKEKLNIVRTKDCYHKALIYCLGINADTRANADSIYDFQNGLVKPDCLHAGWQTSGSSKVTRIAMNLYCNGTPSVIKESNYEDQISEISKYTVEELFCCGYAPFFWQAIQIRYPEYAVYNFKLAKLFGGDD